MPRDVTSKPITPRGRNIITRVDELIDPYTGQRNVPLPLLEQVFWEEDVHLIRTISVHVEMEDAVG